MDAGKMLSQTSKHMPGPFRAPTPCFCWPGQSLAALAACVEASVFLDPRLPVGIRQSSHLSLPMLTRLHSSS